MNKADTETLLGLATLLDDLGFQATAEIVAEHVEYDARPAEVIRVALDDIRWHHDQAADPDDEPTYAAAEAAVRAAGKLLK